MNQLPGPETNPVLIRAGALVTVVGASEPSLTVVEFKDSLGLLLAEGFQQDSYSTKLVFELAQLARSDGRDWSTTEYHRVCFDGTVCSASLKPTRPARAVGSISAQFAPVVTFISRAELVRLESMFLEAKFEKLIAFARTRAIATANLSSSFDSLLNRQRLRRLRPLKATVRIELPPRPTGSKSVCLEIPPPPKPPSLQ